MVHIGILKVLIDALKILVPKWYIVVFNALKVLIAPS